MILVMRVFNMFDQPWEVHPDSELPINEGGIDETSPDQPF